MIKCPVCNEFDFPYDSDAENDFEICGICEWGYDIVQHNDPDFFGGFNKESLNEARIAWNASKIKSA